MAYIVLAKADIFRKLCMLTLLLYLKTIVMENIQQISKKTPSVFSADLMIILRVALGLCLFIKGFSFMRNSAMLENLVAQTSFGSYSQWLVLVITWTHLLGGFLVAIGLLTRWAVLLQIPILLGAVIFVSEASQNTGEFFFALLVLLLLIFFLIKGAGLMSLDSYFSKHPV